MRFFFLTSFSDSLLWVCESVTDFCRPMFYPATLLQISSHRGGFILPPAFTAYSCRTSVSGLFMDPGLTDFFEGVQASQTASFSGGADEARATGVGGGGGGEGETGINMVSGQTENHWSLKCQAPGKLMSYSKDRVILG